MFVGYFSLSRKPKSRVLLSCDKLAKPTAQPDQTVTRITGFIIIINVFFSSSPRVCIASIAVPFLILSLSFIRTFGPVSALILIKYVGTTILQLYKFKYNFFYPKILRKLIKCVFPLFVDAVLNFAMNLPT